MNYSSVFIHLSPSLISWSFRWFTSDVIAAYPSIFKPMSVAAVESVTLVDMLNPFVCVYMAWMVPYTIWLWCGGMYESPDTTGRETSWHAQVRQCICILRIHSLVGCHFSWVSRQWKCMVPAYLVWSNATVILHIRFYILLHLFIFHHVGNGSSTRPKNAGPSKRA